MQVNPKIAGDAINAFKQNTSDKKIKIYKLKKNRLNKLSTIRQ